jgi:NAD+ synthase (glutamine-hydrolysing)
MKNNYGFTRVAAAVPKVCVADCEANVQEILTMLRLADAQDIQTVCFPELSVTAYTCGDLFFQRTLIRKAEQAVAGLLRETRDMPLCFLVGVPVEHDAKLYNCAAVIHAGRLLGIVPKTHLPNYSEFYEKRWFRPGAFGELPIRIEYAGNAVPFGSSLLFDCGGIGCGGIDCGGAKFAVEICEDLWAVIPPGSVHATAGASLIFNLSASNELTGKRQYVKSLTAQQSARCHAAYVYASSGFGESTTDTVYTGNAYIYENGRLLAETERFRFDGQLIVSDIDIELLNAERKKNTTFAGNPSAARNYVTVAVNLPPCREPRTLRRVITPSPFLPDADRYNESCEEIFSIQVAGLAKRFLHTRAESLILGVSGGLDSTLALLVCVRTADRLGLSRRAVCGLTMPGFGTSERTHTNAVRLMEPLGITAADINITAACEQHFRDIAHDPAVHDVTYENTQARERTQILMDLANQKNGLVVGTGDMSELALGWATYNGDHMSMYGVNAGIPKTLVRYLVKWVAENQMEAAARQTLLDIIDTPVSPELLPKDPQGKMTQFTEDLIGPYQLHDFFLFHTLRYGFSPRKIRFLAQHAFRGTYDAAAILKWLDMFYRRFFSQQFKRSCMPDGPKVGSVNLSPRGDWRMPSDACVRLWIREIEEMKEETEKIR